MIMIIPLVKAGMNESVMPVFGRAEIEATGVPLVLGVSMVFRALTVGIAVGAFDIVGVGDAPGVRVVVNFALGEGLTVGFGPPPVPPITTGTALT